MQSLSRCTLPLVATALLLTGAGCSTLPSPTASWVPATNGPWNGALHMATSEDGITFHEGNHILAHAGVPNLLALENGTLILTYQYFSYDTPDMFDVIAYSISTDNGATWSDPQRLELVGVPDPIGKQKSPMDPTLVQRDDGALVLYFTYHEEGERFAALYTAIAEDGNITSPFTVHTPYALALRDANLLDPAVVHFNGMWHHYSWRDGSEENYHSTSTDGITFTREDNIAIPMDFLGQVIPMDDGLRFYGTGKGGVISAYSTDGYTWVTDLGIRARGADPGIQQLRNGTYLMVYTSANFNPPSNQR